MVTMATKQVDLGQSQLARLIKGEYDYTRPRRGEVYEATILAISENDMLVDLGVKRDGIVPPKDLDLVDDVAYVDSLKIGDRVPVVVLKTWGNHDGILVSLNKGLQRQDWLRAQELLEKEQVVEAEVTDSNRGGVIVPFGRVARFRPEFSSSLDTPRVARRPSTESKGGTGRTKSVAERHLGGSTAPTPGAV
jgi:ribosomal protein S1